MKNPIGDKANNGHGSAFAHPTSSTHKKTSASKNVYAANSSNTGVRKKRMPETRRMGKGSAVPIKWL